ncbi:MAG: urea ABC transporter permease subunit UrtB, partial [Pseudomonadota bacterium]
MRRLFLTLLIVFGIVHLAAAQDIQTVLQTHAEEVAKPSRNSVGTVLDDLQALGAPGVLPFLENWQSKGVWQREADGLFFIATEADDTLSLTDIDSGAQSEVPAAGFTQLKPNGGVRRVIGTALVQFQLMDPDLRRRETAVASIARRPAAAQLEPLLASIEGEEDPTLRARKTQLSIFLSARFADTTEARIAAIDSLATDTSVEARAVLNQILSTKSGVAETLPEDANIARILTPGEALTADEAYTRLVEAELAPPRTPPDAIRAALEANIT